MSVERRFCASWILCFLTVFVSGVLLTLGTWQMNRAAEKRSILEQQQQMQQQSPLIRLDTGQSVDALRHRDVRLQGRFDGDHQFLLDNQIRRGKVGYSVLTPFQLSGGGWALVDRGWVEQGLSRQLLPDVSVHGGAQELRGEVYVPFGKPYSLGEFDQGAMGWPLVVQFLDFDGMAERLGRDLLPLTIRLSPDDGDGYLREWTVVAMGPHKHIGYAVQWYSMAAVFIALMWLVNRKRTKT